MSTVQHFNTSISKAEAARLIEQAQSRTFTEAEIDAMAAADNRAWTDDDLANANRVFAVQTPEDVRDLRTRMGLSRAQFAQKFGLTLDTVQQYEQGRRRPSGPASTLLRVIDAEPEAMVRALRRR